MDPHKARVCRLCFSADNLIDIYDRYQTNLPEIIRKVIGKVRALPFPNVNLAPAKSGLRTQLVEPAATGARKKCGAQVQSILERAATQRAAFY